MSKGKPIGLFTPGGRQIALGRKLGCGGEGAIYAIRGQDGLAAKVYVRPTAPELAAKLRLMVARHEPRLASQAAWPLDTLHHGASSGPVRGFVMPRVAGGKEIHRLYTLKDRRTAFPNADWRFLAHVARNCASAFEDVHAADCCVGDVNQKNILVMPDGTVRLIDCDSFQVRTPGGVVYPCAVGVPEFTPPELQGADFRVVTRTADHDNFGLAVLIFHLLFVGRHPFAGLRDEGEEQSLTAAIQERRFAYSRCRDVGVSPPPNVPTLDVIPRSLAALFERAFPAADSRRHRPAARVWLEALQRFVDELRPCPLSALHYTHPAVTGCFWCEAERQGIHYFGEPPPRVASETTFSVREASRVTTTLPPPAVTAPAPSPPTAAVRAPAPQTPPVAHGPLLRWDVRSALDGDYGIIGMVGGCVAIALLLVVFFLVAAGAFYLNIGLAVLIERAWQLKAPPVDPMIFFFLLFFVSFPLSAAGGCHLVLGLINRYIIQLE